MNLFADTIQELRDFLDERRAGLRELEADDRGWTQGEKGNIVLSSDTGAELGNPRDESASFMVWTEDAGAVTDSRVNLLGPDISESKGGSLPFGKVIIVKVRGMDENNCYERHREMDIARYNLSLKGYMMRAVSQYMREWSRVSLEAVDKGFSFSVLAGALREIYKKIDFVEAVEFLFVTSSPDDVRRLAEKGARVERLIGAMNKMATELSFECGTCDYTDVCAEVEGLRDMKNNKKDKV